MLEECRKQLGDEIELLHDIHERVSPREAVQFAKDVEPLKLFFLEGRGPPEDIAYFRQSGSSRTPRSPWASCSTARTNGHRSSPSRLIDYIRIHIRRQGGLTPSGRSSSSPSCPV